MLPLHQTANQTANRQGATVTCCASDAGLSFIQHRLKSHWHHHHHHHHWAFIGRLLLVKLRTQAPNNVKLKSSKKRQKAWRKR